MVGGCENGIKIGLWSIGDMYPLKGSGLESVTFGVLSSPLKVNTKKDKIKKTNAAINA
jgi:hypothetical protein